MFEVIGEVAGKTVLDAGCAAGEYVAHFLRNGARVTAVDASAALIAIVNERFGETVQAKQHDLLLPMPWMPDASMDLVVSSLTMHYLSDWSVPLSEFYRVLKPGGRLVLSTHHPMMISTMFADQLSSYFETAIVRDVWKVGGRKHDVWYYHRSFQSILSSLSAAGFHIERMIEPRVTEVPPDVQSKWFKTLQNSPWFMIIESLKLP